MTFEKGWRQRLTVEQEAALLAKAAATRARNKAEQAERDRLYEMERQKKQAKLDRARARRDRSSTPRLTRKVPGGGDYVFEPVPDRYIEKRGARFWAYVDRSGGPDACWPWHGGQARDINTGVPLDYGAASWCGRPTGAHRVAWMLANGHEIPGGLVVDHLCCVKWCVNGFKHLQVVTHSENTSRQKRRKPEDTRTPTSFQPPWDDRWYPFGRRLYDEDGERLA